VERPDLISRIVGRHPTLTTTLAVCEAGPPSAPKPRLLDRVRHAIGASHYSRRTEKAYVHWIKRYIFFHGKRHPAEMGAAEVTEFLTSLAVHGKVAASTQNQALSALLFLYREVLSVELPWLDGLVRAKPPQRLPVVLTREEVRTVLGKLDGVPRLMAFLLYGAGLRLLECCRLRVKDVDFGTNQVVIRDGKGNKDRVTMLPATVKAELAAHIERGREQHHADLRQGAGWVELPWALARKYPNAGREWGWQWVFPATRIYVERLTGQRRRHHLHRICPPEGGEARGPECRHRQAGHVPHLPTLVRHPPAGGQPRHPDSSGVAGPPGCDHDHDLHPRSQPRPSRRPESGRSDVSVMTRPREPRSAAGAGVLNCGATRDNTAAEGHRRVATYRQLRAGWPRPRPGDRCWTDQPSSCYAVPAISRSAARQPAQTRGRGTMRITLLAVMLSLGMVSLALGQNISLADQEMMKIRQAMTEEYAAAVARKDAVAMADHYTVDVVTAGLCPETPPVVGREAKTRQSEGLLKAGFRDYAGKIKEARILSDGSAWSTGVSEFTINGKDGAPVRVRGNWVDILRREGKEWRVSFQAFARTPCSP